MTSNRILFQKPNLKELTKKYTVVDTHFHTVYSDGINKVAAIVNHAKKLGIGIAITDHNAIKGAIEIEKYKGILTIPGIEVTSHEGTHILVYFYTIDDLKLFYKNYVKPHMGYDVMSPISLKMEEIISAAKKFKSVVMFPHPNTADIRFHSCRFSELITSTPSPILNNESIRFPLKL
jgi:predicted metal-dependent phosphoesterase TrpH